MPVGGANQITVRGNMPPGSQTCPTFDSPSRRASSHPVRRRGRWTNQMQEAQVYSHGGPIGCRGPSDWAALEDRPRASLPVRRWWENQIFDEAAPSSTAPGRRGRCTNEMENAQ
eukprot:5475604-Pyramimonas_sp.AAC.1